MASAAVKRILFMGGSQAPSAQAIAFLNRAGALSSEYKDAYINLINGGVTDGWFGKLDALYVFAAPDSGTALLSLINSTFNASNSAVPASFTAGQGFTGNGLTSFINSNFNPTTATTPNYVQNSNCLFGWCGTVAQDASPFLGENIDAVQKTVVTARDGSNLTNYRANSSGAVKTVANTDGSGFYHMNRSASSAVQLYKAGVQIDSTAAQTSAAPVNTTLVFLKGNTSFSSDLCYCGGFGSSLNSTDALNLYNRLHSYLQTIAGVA